MSWIAGARARAAQLLNRRAAEERMDEEIRFHIEMEAERLVREEGLQPTEARRRAVLAFGGVEGHREVMREGRRIPVLEELWRDVRYAIRSLRRSPAFAAAAVLTLALGIGANTAVFSLVSASLLRPPPFPEVERLVVLHQTFSDHASERGPFRWWSPPQFRALRSSLHQVEGLSAYWQTDVNLSSGGVEPVRIRTELVSPDYFTTLGVQPALGRTFLPQEDSVPGAHPVAIVGHDLWERHFGAAPAAVGRSIRLNAVPLTVVGVMPPGFRGLSGEAEVWMPHAMAPSVHMPDYLSSDQYFLGVIGRLPPGGSVEQANAEMATVGAGTAADVRAAGGGEEFGPGTWGAGLARLEEARRNPTAVRAYLVLAGAVAFVLLIAVVNLSALLLARSSARARETGVRAALGASRMRLVRHGLVEGGLLGLMGGALGVLLAAWSVEALVALAPEGWGAPRLSVAGLGSFARPDVDWRVVSFAAATALLAGLLAGLIPALRSTRGDLTHSIKNGARGSSVGVGTLRRPTLLSAAALAQIACALVLLVGAGLLLQGFDRLRSVDPGLDPDGVLTFDVTLPRSQYGEGAEVPLLERVLERVEAVPGVESATVGCAPFGGCWSTALQVDGQDVADRLPSVRLHSVRPGYFRALGVPLRRGRAFSAQDRAGQPRVAVINKTAARRFWPGQDPVGRRVWLGFDAGVTPPDSAVEIVGVVGDVLYEAPDQEVRPGVYIPHLQLGRAPGTVIVRAAGDPGALVPAIRRAVAEVDPNLPIHGVRTLQDRRAEALAEERFATLALGAFAGLGLVLAGLGVYGVMAYSVAQRRREIGIRLALGASPRMVLRVVVGQGLALASVGLVVGAAASLALSRALPALVAGIGPANPVVFAAAVPLLFLAALLACYLPARSSARVSPVEALTGE